ncbi:MAG TPA: DUF1553 domain-containing protein, partial [Verrucomicrobia bacterium]|nr:DUF1553 domain-containing protein [Verrucomicrobiota bacterium]
AEKLSCARCHDAPDHPHRQIDTFSLAAMLKGKPIPLPSSSTVPMVQGFRKPKVTVSLKPGEVIHPEFPFRQLSPESELSSLIPLSGGVPETRNEVARTIISPSNKRFAQVIANRVWKRYLGIGLVEPAGDWSKAIPSHPDLLKYLAREFILSGYDLKTLAKQILNSHVYQREPDAGLSVTTPLKERLFAGPMRRRMAAEQLVDSLLLASGKRMDTGELSLNPLGDRPLTQFLNLGYPEKAWEFTALMNERDRPSLSLPVAQSVVDVLSIFGWRQSRQTPTTDRKDAPSPMQSLILANGILGTRMVRLSDQSVFTEIALNTVTLEDLLDRTFMRILSRLPHGSESRMAAEFLENEFPARIRKGSSTTSRRFRTDLRVSWANHFDERASAIRMEEERRLRLGAPPTERLSPEFRERYEDLIWSLINSPEFILIP